LKEAKDYMQDLFFHPYIHYHLRAKVEFHELGKGKVSFQVCVTTGSMDGVVGPLMDGFQKAIDALFFGWGFGGVIVSELSADLFKQVDVFSDVSAIYVSKLLNGLAK
jgi:hypothetical protein